MKNEYYKFIFKKIIFKEIDKSLKLYQNHIEMSNKIKKKYITTNKIYMK